ncbi:MAG: DNA-protecting protein DprA [Epulopiscium sp.]|nr:DNA-protecting protein DprA [Candidatus Epulonipiscium sp.]
MITEGDFVEGLLESTIYWFWISNLKGLKKSRIQQLLKHFKTPKNIWKLGKNEIKSVINISEEELNILERSKNYEGLIEALFDLKEKNIFFYSIQDEAYPVMLRNIPNPPPGIYVKGQLPAFEKGYIAIVGSRNCTEYGKNVVRELGRELVKRGIGIISGLAYGIDSEAHKVALEFGGNTVAVLANGLDNCYPPGNINLMKSIEVTGALISEYPPTTKAIPSFFPARNRIISGLSKGVLIVEAGEKSGALITADLALEQGKEVFAVPGSIFSSTSTGTNKLIQQGAKLVTKVEDILEEIKLNMDIYNKYNNKEDKPYKNESISGLALEENIVYDCISFEATSMEYLSVKTKYNIDKLQAILTLLEIKGLIKQLPGKKFIRI